jgi:hypothetical protein
MIWDIDLIFGIRVYSHKLQINLKFVPVEWFLVNLQLLGFEICCRFLIISRFVQAILFPWINFVTTGTIACKTRCVGTTRIFPPWILRRLANVSPFFNSLSNRLRITNYSLRSVSSSLLKFTKFIQGNNIAWTNLDMIRNLQQISKPNSCKLTKNHSTGTNFKFDL